MNDRELKQSISPRVLVVKKTKHSIDKNCYKSKNYTHSVDLYETQEGEEVGEQVIGFAEVETGTVIEQNKEIQKFQDQLQDKAESILWYSDRLDNYRVEDIAYQVRNTNRSSEIEEIQEKVWERLQQIEDELVLYDLDREDVDEIVENTVGEQE